MNIHLIGIMALYFEYQDSETAFPKAHFAEIAKEKGLSEMTVFEAKPYNDNDYFFCKLHGVGEKGFCGRQCGDYAAKNGKSGVCKHTGQLCQHGNSVTLKFK